MAIRRINESLAYNDETKTLYLKHPYCHHCYAKVNENGKLVHANAVLYGGEFLKLDLSHEKVRLCGPRGSIPFSFSLTKRDDIVIGVGSQPNIMRLGGTFASSGLSAKAGLIQYLEEPKPDKTIATYIRRILQHAADQAKISMEYTSDFKGDAALLQEKGLADGHPLSENEMLLVYGPERWHEPVPNLSNMITNEQDFTEKFSLLQSWHPQNVADSLYLTGVDVNDLHASIYREGNDKIAFGCHCGDKNTRIKSGFLDTSLKFSDCASSRSFCEMVRREMESYIVNSPSSPVSVAARYKTGCDIPYADSLDPHEAEDLYFSSVMAGDIRARSLGQKMEPLSADSAIEPPKMAYQRALQLQEGMPTEYDCAEHLDWFTPKRDAKAMRVMLDKGYEENLCKETVEKYSPGAALNAFEKVRYSMQVMNMAKHLTRGKGIAR